MPTTIPAVLLFQGHASTLAGGITTLQEVWLSQNLRPDLTTTYLPDIGDNPLSGNIIGAQSIIVNYLTELKCKNIQEGEYIEGGVRGTIYNVSYDDSLDTGSIGEPTQDEDVVILRINGSVSTQVYSPGSDDSPTLQVYDPDSATYSPFKSSIPVVFPSVNIETTKRYRNKTPAEIIAICAAGGSINTAAQWGIPAGNLLYQGASADPIGEVIDQEKKINWNITRRYQARFLTGVANNTWQYVFFKGSWVRVEKVGGGNKDFYTAGTLPNDLA